jgi:hypothetical protein
MANHMASRILALCVAPLVCLGLAAATLEAQAPPDVVRRAAVRWLDALDAEQRSRALTAFDGEARFDWGYTPRARSGLRIGGASELQRERLAELLGAVFDDATLAQFEQIRELERVLFERESRPGAPATWRDYDEYYVTLFGDPRSEERWGWRFEGHHISLNVTALGERVVGVTPLFLGASPARSVGSNGADVRPLGEEERVGRELFESLDEAQRERVGAGQQLPGDILAQPGRETPEPKGLRAAELKDEQRARLAALVELFARRLRGNARDERLAALREGLEGARLVWVGSAAPGERCYWRVHVGGNVFEYDDSVPAGNHVHTLWRDAGADFGGSAVRAR